MSSTIKKKQKNKQRFWTNTHTPWTRFHSARSVCVCACLLLLLFFPFFRCVRFTLSISLSVFFPLSLSLRVARWAGTHIYISLFWLTAFFAISYYLCVSFAWTFPSSRNELPNHPITLLFFFFSSFFFGVLPLSLFILLPSFTLLDPHACTPTSSQRSL